MTFIVSESQRIDRVPVFVDYLEWSPPLSFLLSQKGVRITMVFRTKIMFLVEVAEKGVMT